MPDESRRQDVAADIGDIADMTALDAARLLARWRTPPALDLFIEPQATHEEWLREVVAPELLDALYAAVRRGQAIGVNKVRQEPWRTINEDRLNVMKAKTRVEVTPPWDE